MGGSIMSYDPTMEPTVLDNIRYMIEDIVNDMDVKVSGRLELELSEYVDMVVTNGDRPNNVPTRGQVLFLMVERLLQIGVFTTDTDLIEMNKYYNNIGEK
jgi:hypothetical protein|tara:strand:- start:469 stop:768 length:300 start_codon:yes stop_codon:yes gene_type:complete